MTLIVTTHYRYRRPPRKRQAAALESPAVVKTSTPQPVEGAGNNDRAPARIITMRRWGAKEARKARGRLRRAWDGWRGR